MNASRCRQRRNAIIRATTDRPSTVTPQLEPATLSPLATSVSHGVRIPARSRSTQVLTRSSILSHGVRCEATNAPARTMTTRTSHVVVVMVTGCGSGGGSPVGRRLRWPLPMAWPAGRATGAPLAATRLVLSLNTCHLRWRQSMCATVGPGKPLGSHLLRHVPGVHAAHDLVPEVGGGPEHEGTPSVDHGDAVLSAVAGGGVRDAARAGAPVHPHVLDAELGALAHGVLGDLGPCSDHHRLDPAGDRRQILIAPVPLDLAGVRVDREDLIAALAQPPVHVIAPVGLGRAGHPRDRYSLTGQERGRGLINALHDSSFVSADRGRESA